MIKILPIIERGMNEGIQKIYKFNNGYGASVIKHKYSYGFDKEQWELGVIRFTDGGNWSLNYDTPITDDVIGYLEREEVEELLERIRGLE